MLVVSRCRVCVLGEVMMGLLVVVFSCFWWCVCV